MIAPATPTSVTPNAAARVVGVAPSAEAADAATGVDAGSNPFITMLLQSVGTTRPLSGTSSTPVVAGGADDGDPLTDGDGAGVPAPTGAGGDLFVMLAAMTSVNLPVAAPAAPVPVAADKAPVSLDHWPSANALAIATPVLPDATMAAVAGQSGGEQRKLEPAGTGAPLDHPAAALARLTGATLPDPQTMAVPHSSPPVARHVAAPQASDAAPSSPRLDTGGAWIDRLAADIVAARASDSRLRFQLAPEALGTIVVDLRGHHDSRSLTITTDNGQAFALISEARDRLADQLRVAGSASVAIEVGIGQSSRQDSYQPPAARAPVPPEMRDPPDQPTADQPPKARRARASVRFA